ncbi:MAG: Na+/H+ antiporter NhaC family protein [Desulfovibrionaceae bacterium]
MPEEQSRGAALLPLGLFLVIFIGTGALLTSRNVDMAFYQLSATVAIFPAIVWALIQGKDDLNKKISIFMAGVGDINIITMCMIYLLAGAFATVATTIGGVSATVNFGLSLVSPQWILPGLFLIGAFVSTAMGTSMGTIAAIAPIAMGIGAQTDIPVPMLMGVVVGGAMFGDNLSMISDTTIAATRTQGCDMGDKFRMNLLIALPAAVVALVLFWSVGSSGQVVQSGDYELIKVLPYLLILGLAVAGINVFVVLLVGIVFCGAIGLVNGQYTLLLFSQDVYKGFTSMNEIMVLSMLIGGLGEIIRYQGGIRWLLEKVDKLSCKLSGGRSAKAGEWCISLLVGLADVCTANNTVAIILSGGMSREIAEKNGIDSRRSASLLDIVSCVVQGLIPYAAQLLLAGSIAKISPVSVAANNWYCMLLGLAAAAAILLGLPKAPIKKSVA